jgi:hypothetical protein
VNQSQSGDLVALLAIDGGLCGKPGPKRGEVGAESGAAAAKSGTSGYLMLD